MAISCSTPNIFYCQLYSFRASYIIWIPSLSVTRVVWAVLGHFDKEVSHSFSYSLLTVHNQIKPLPYRWYMINLYLTFSLFLNAAIKAIACDVANIQIISGHCYNSDLITLVHHFTITAHASVNSLWWISVYKTIESVSL